MKHREEIIKDSYVRISNDGLEAWLYLREPEEGKQYTKDGLMAMVKEYGVTEGLNYSNLSGMAKKGVYNREVKIAAGKDKSDGVDGRYEFYFKPEEMCSKPAVREDGSVDYTSVKMLQNVHKGDKIALYHPAKPGVDGFTVQGAVIQAKKSKEMPPIGGRSILHAEDNPNLYIAAMDGKVQIKNNKIDIQNVHEINEDVDVLTGKVEFYGDVIVNGNVESGVVIRAGRNLTIKGNVEACSLYAGGDVILERGMQGAEKGSITAKGSVMAEFLEYCKVSAGQNVQANSILSSDIFAGGKVTVNGKKGKIVSGHCHARQGIEAQNLGNIAEIRTVVHTGFTEEEYGRLVDANKREVELLDKAGEVNRELSELIPKCKLSDNKTLKLRMNEALSLRDKYKKELSELKEEKAGYEETIRRGRGSYILVKGQVQRGVIICMENSKLPVERSTSFVKYTVENGVINGTVVTV